MAQGEHKYRVWIRKKMADGISMDSSMSHHSVEDIQKSTDKIIDLEPMASFDIAEFGSLPINLIISAFAIFVSSLSASNSTLMQHPEQVGLILVVLVLILISILNFLATNKGASPDDFGARKSRTIMCIFLGTCAMIIVLAM